MHNINGNKYIGMNVDMTSTISHDLSSILCMDGFKIRKVNTHHLYFHYWVENRANYTSINASKFSKIVHLINRCLYFISSLYVFNLLYARR